MANYRTLKQLQSYMGHPITRMHKNGSWYYFSKSNDGAEINARSLKEIKRIIKRDSESNLFVRIWNNAYYAYAEGDYYLMWDYLREQVNSGNMSYGDAQTMAHDIVGTANL